MWSFSHGSFNHVKTVLNILNEANLRCSPEKCFFGYVELIILGYHISGDGIRVATDKLLVMDTWKAPVSGNQLEKHLGFFNYFREMIPNYSKLMAPLERLRKAPQISWTEEFQFIYKKVRSILTSDLVLSYPDFSQEFCPRNWLGALSSNKRKDSFHRLRL